VPRAPRTIMGCPVPAQVPAPSAYGAASHTARASQLLFMCACMRSRPLLKVGIGESPCQFDQRRSGGERASLAAVSFRSSRPARCNQNSRSAGHLTLFLKDEEPATQTSLDLRGCPLNVGNRTRCPGTETAEFIGTPGARVPPRRLIKSVSLSRGRCHACRMTGKQALQVQPKPLYPTLLC